MMMTDDVVVDVRQVEVVVHSTGTSAEKGGGSGVMTVIAIFTDERYVVMLLYR